MAAIPFVNVILQWITLLSNILILVILGDMLFVKGRFSKWIYRNRLLGMFVVSLVATLGSLYYSEIAGYMPCKLCWFQRIFMYPQVLLLGMALWKKSKRIIPYSILLSVVGLVVAGYHYFLQRSASASGFCEVIGVGASCSDSFVMAFGYITIAWMAFSAFLLLILLGWKSR